MLRPSRRSSPTIQHGFTGFRELKKAKEPRILVRNSILGGAECEEFIDFSKLNGPVEVNISSIFVFE